MNEVVVGTAAYSRTTLRADDAGRNRLPNAEGVTDGERDIADLSGRRICRCDRCQAAGRHFNHREIRFGIVADKRGRGCLAVSERDENFVCAVYHVIVCEYVACFAHDHAGAE